jgi:hypothetical protein
MFSSHSTRTGLGLDQLFRPGDHACYFFRSGDEIGEVLIPYFKAGLERNERCVWLTGHPYGKDRAASALRAAVADFDRRASAGQIAILDHAEVYAGLSGKSTAEKVQVWAAQRDEAVAAGYAGLRSSGNGSFLSEASWDGFLSCERAANAIFAGQPVTILCGYSFDRCPARGVVEVVHCHGFALAKRHGAWGLVEVRKNAGGIADGEAGRGDRAATASAARGHELRLLVEDQLAMFVGGCPERIELAGGEVWLSGPQATNLAILLSELAQNAARYGALASRQGRLVVQWRVVSNGSRRLHVTWIESGAADLAMPERIGSGTRLLARTVENPMRVFSGTGMACSFELPLEESDA